MALWLTLPVGWVGGSLFSLTMAKAREDNQKRCYASFFFYSGTEQEGRPRVREKNVRK